MAGRSGGDARDPPAHDEHIGARIRQFAAAARELRALGGRELVEPDSGVNGHEPIVCDDGHLDHGQGEAECLAARLTMDKLPRHVSCVRSRAGGLVTSGR